MKYTISKVISVFDKDKNGNLLRTKKGDTYRKATVNFEEEGEKMIGLFLWGNSDAQAGFEYEGIIEPQEYNGKTYLTFKGEQKVDKKDEEIAQLKFSLANAHAKIDNIVGYLKEKPWLKPVQPETTSDGKPMPTI